MSKCFCELRFINSYLFFKKYKKPSVVSRVPSAIHRSEL